MGCFTHNQETMLPIRGIKEWTLAIYLINFAAIPRNNQQFMLRLISYILICCCFSICLQAQNNKQFDINSNTVFKDKDGNRVGFETFLEWTSGKGYSMEPIFNDDGSLKEILVLEPSVSSGPLQSNEFGSTPELVEQAPPHFDAYDMQGQFISSENYFDKVIVLKFWFTACRPCVEEMPKLNRLVAKYQHHPDVVFLAPSIDDVQTINHFLSRQDFGYKILPNARPVAQAYNVLGYPTHVVIGKSGKVEAVFQGVNRNIGEKLSAAIESGLGRQTQTLSNQLNPPNRISQDRMPNQSEFTSRAVSAVGKQDVLEVNPNSIIIDENNKQVSFDQFIELMNSKQYELKPDVDAVGNAIIKLVPSTDNR